MPSTSWRSALAPRTGCPPDRATWARSRSGRSGMPSAKRPASGSRLVSRVPAVGTRAERGSARNTPARGCTGRKLRVEGPVRFSEALPLPELPAEVPRKPDGAPAFCSEVAVLAVPEKERLPGFDFLFDLGQAVRTVDRVTLHNAAVESAVKEFVLHASATGKEAADLHEVFRGALEARSGPQSFRVPAFRHDSSSCASSPITIPAGRLALAEFEAFAPDGTNIVTIQGPEGRKMTGGLVRFTAEEGQERQWKAENINDGRTSGARGSWAAQDRRRSW